MVTLLRGARVASALALGLALTGCADLSYYWQSVNGHLAVLGAARPVSAWLDDPTTPDALRQRLQLSQRLRDFASQQLSLPDNAAYRRYADLQRTAVVWNVVAAPELSLSLKTWCFALLGCVGYRGYFARDEAEQLARQLRGQGWEVSVYGVPAYSTLGKLPGSYFADPLLNTFIDGSELELARLIFHELAHQVAYADDDTAFNESFATAVERLGSQAWLDSGQASAGAAEAFARIESRRRDVRALMADTRAALQALYASGQTEQTKRDGKADLMRQMRERQAALKAGAWQGYAGYDDWFARANNATLAVQGAYHDRVADFEALFDREHRQWPAFFAQVRRLAALPRAERDDALRMVDPHLSAPHKPTARR